MIPKFDTYYTNLHSSFLIFDKFLEFLKNEFLNGFVLIEGYNKKAYMFMFEGEVQSCLTATNTGYKKISSLEFSSLPAKDSFVSTCRCFHEQVDFFSKAHTARKVDNIFSKDNMDPVKLIDQCRTEKFTGYMDIGDTVVKKKRYIYFYNGVILGSMNLNNKDGYFEMTPDSTPIRNKLLNTDIHLYRLSPDVRDPVKDRKSLINCFEQIFKLLETQGKNKDFSLVWRKCALELGDKFVFLDPFAGEFNYKNGKIDLWEKVNLNIAAHGIDELIRLIAKRTTIPVKNIMTIKNKYSNILADYEIKN
jgi:hypothetical protein